MEGKYPKGSFLQRMFEPFAGATKDEHGTLVYTLEEQELAEHHLNDDEKLRAEYEKAKEKVEAWELDEENEGARDKALLKELEEDRSQFSINEF